FSPFRPTPFFSVNVFMFTVSPDALIMSQYAPMDCWLFDPALITNYAWDSGNGITCKEFPYDLLSLVAISSPPLAIFDFRSPARQVATESLPSNGSNPRRPYLAECEFHAWAADCRYH